MPDERTVDEVEQELRDQVCRMVVESAEMALTLISIRAACDEALRKYGYLA